MCFLFSSGRVEQRRWHGWGTWQEVWSPDGLSSCCLASLARIHLLINSLLIDFMFSFFSLLPTMMMMIAFVSLRGRNSVGFFWGEVMLYWTIICFLISSYCLFLLRKKKLYVCWSLRMEFWDTWSWNWNNSSTEPLESTVEFNGKNRTSSHPMEELEGRKKDKIYHLCYFVDIIQDMDHQFNGKIYGVKRAFSLFAWSPCRDVNGPSNYPDYSEHPFQKDNRMILLILHSHPNMNLGPLWLGTEYGVYIIILP